MKFPVLPRSKDKARRPKPSRNGRGSLIILATLFGVSAILRLGDGPGAALAREIESLTQAQKGVGTTDVETPNDPALSLISEEHLADLLQNLQTREAALLLREREVGRRIAAADLAEDRIADGLEMLDMAEADLRATMALAEDASESDLSQLTLVYENMKPAEAAPLFAQMSPGFAAGFLGRMRPDAAAAILAGLDPEAGYAISVILAGRNADVPVPEATDKAPEATNP